MNTTTPGALASRVDTGQLRRERRVKNRGIVMLIVVTLLMVVALLLIAEPLNQWTSETEKYWMFISTASTIIGGSVGLWFVWLKFIRARDFAPKVDITLTAGKVFLSESEGNLHWCDVRLENRGTVALVYRMNVSYMLYRNGDTVPGETLESLVPDDDLWKSVVDVGATSYDHYIVRIPFDQAQAVIFQVRVWGDDQQTDWWNHITVSNARESS